MNKATFLFSAMIIMLGCEGKVDTLPPAKAERSITTKPTVKTTPIPDTSSVVLKISGMMKSKGDAT